ncbi:serine hydrolase domain-containing protein [Pyxidicoccus sp. 3LG]
MHLAVPLLSSLLAAAPAAKLPSAAELAPRIDALAAETLKEGPVVGLSLAVVRGGDVVIQKGYGKANLELGVPVTEQSLFRIGSITKQFTAAAIMQLVEQGKVKLDDDVTKYVDFPTHGKRITLRHLLTHTSGLKNYTKAEDFPKKAPLELTPDEVLALVKDVPPLVEPGSKWAYSNTGYFLLGLVIEKASGMKYADYLEKNVFPRAGLQRTWYCDVSRILPHRVAGYTLQKGQPVNAEHLGMSVPYAAGSLCSTAPELVEWARALETGKVVSPESYTLMTTPVKTTDGKGAPYPYGFGLSMVELEDHPTVEHGGGINGFAANLMRLPKDDLTVVVLFNTEGRASPMDLSAKLARLALGIPEPVVKDLPLSADEARRYEGTYAREKTKWALRFVDGKLRMRPSYLPATEEDILLLYQGDGDFVPKGESVHYRFEAGTGPSKRLRLFDGKRAVMEATRVP